MHADSASLPGTCAHVAKLPTHCLFVFLHKLTFFTKIGQEYHLRLHRRFWPNWEKLGFLTKQVTPGNIGHMCPLLEKYQTYADFDMPVWLLLGQRDVPMFFFTIRDVMSFTGDVILLRAAADKLEQQSAFKNQLLKLSAPDIKKSKSAISVKIFFGGLSKAWKK